MQYAGSLKYDTELDGKGFEKGLNGLNSTAVAVGNLMADAFKKASQVLIDTVKQGVQYNAQLEQSKVALTTLTGSAEKADKIMKNIREDASKTPFDVAGLTRANQLLISTGLDSDKAREDILALGNAISATGGGEEELSRMAINMQQIRNVGRATAIDIKQFAYAGIDLYSLVAKSTGLSKEVVSDGEQFTITYDIMAKALRDASAEGGVYFGAMENQSKTLNGQWSTLKDNFNEFAGRVAEPLFNFLKDTALPVLNDLMTGGGKIGAWIKKNEQPLTLLGILIGTITTALIAYTIAQNAAAIVTGISTAVMGAFGAVMAFVTSPITLVILAIGALIAIGYLLIKNWDTVKEFALKIFSWIADFFKGIVHKIGGFFSGMSDIGKNIVKGIWNGIVGAKDWILNKIKGFAKSITNGIKSFFGIKSPSKVMENQVGQWLPKGIAVGIDDNTDSVIKSIDNMNDEMISRMQKAVVLEAGNINAKAKVSSKVANNSLVQVNAQFSGNVEMDSNKVGRIVTPVVSKTLKAGGL